MFPIVAHWFLKFANLIQSLPLSRFVNERCREIRHNDRVEQRVLSFVFPRFKIALRFKTLIRKKFRVVATFDSQCLVTNVGMSVQGRRRGGSESWVACRAGGKIRELDSVLAWARGAIFDIVGEDPDRPGGFAAAPDRCGGSRHVLPRGRQ